MATLTDQITEARAQLAAAMQAERDALQAAEIRLTSANAVDRTEVMADLNAIGRRVTYWRGIVAGLEAKQAGQPTIGGMTFTSGRFSDRSDPFDRFNC
jgi:hypothetical protein